VLPASLSETGERLGAESAVRAGGRWLILDFTSTKRWGARESSRVPRIFGWANRLVMVACSSLLF